MFYLYFRPEDDRLELSPVDAIYFAIVTTTTIGYGDIVPATQRGRGVMTLYMLVGSVVVGTTLREFMELFVSSAVEEPLVNKILETTLYVHRCDLDDDGQISESDFILFKLQQMQKLDPVLVDRISQRFGQLSDGRDRLIVGSDVPSAEQVAQLASLCDQEEEDAALQGAAASGAAPQQRRDQDQRQRNRPVRGGFGFVSRARFRPRRRRMEQLWAERQRGGQRNVLAREPIPVVVRANGGACEPTVEEGGDEEVDPQAAAAAAAGSDSNGRKPAMLQSARGGEVGLGEMKRNG